MEIIAKRVAGKWYLERDDNSNQVAIDGIKQWDTFPELEALLRSKGMTARGSKIVRKVRPAGRPRTYTPEEYAEHRREANKAYVKARREADPEAVAEEGRKYRASTPEKQKAYRAKSYAARKKRLQEDPEYRAKFNAYQREWRKKGEA